MFYYEVATAGNTRGATSIFTYESNTQLALGTIVNIKVRHKLCLGFIVKKASKPSFNTNALEIYSPQTAIPSELLNTFLDMRQLYPLADSQLASLLTPPNAPKKQTDPAIKTNRATLALPALNAEQSKVKKELGSTPSNAILFGDTGTGKTRIYQHLIADVLSSGKNVLLLAPEIGLASYLYKEMLPFFADCILYHSNLTPKERFTAWQTAAQANKGILAIGPRSVLGLPLHNIGLIIMDEAHDTSYRQDNIPFLHAKVFAAILAKHHSSKCIYGTATPGVAEYYTAATLGNPIVRIIKRAVQSDKTSHIRVVDYADEAERNGGSLLKSSIAAISKAINQGGQVLVLVNRRGTARYVACDSCGHEQRCTTCDHLVVYHHDSYELRCHFCNARYPVPSQCSECGSHEIKMRSYGTKAIVEELTHIYPDVSIKRFDTDTTKKDHLHEHTDELKGGEVQIIVGTQMIAKGLDLPKLKTLVVLSGSSSNGFSGEERDFQLLYQVIGRAMRGHQNTEVLVQTAAPDAHVLRHAIERDYTTFYENELAERKTFLYPPFCHMMIVHISRKTSKGAQSAGLTVQKKINSQYANVTVSSPLPDMTERIGANYHWHLLVKSSKRSRLVNIAIDLGTNYVCELDPIDTP